VNDSLAITPVRLDDERDQRALRKLPAAA